MKKAPVILAPWFVLAVGLLLSAWVTYGRFLFDRGGSLTPIYAVLIGVPMVVLHAFVARAFGKVRRAGMGMRRATLNCLLTAWACFILLGLTIPDRPHESLETIVTGSHDLWVGMAIGIANPAGIIGMGLTVATLILALGDARGPRLSEDEILDAQGL